MTQALPTIKNASRSEEFASYKGKRRNSVCAWCLTLNPLFLDSS
jgi:hypothetical protein